MKLPARHLCDEELLLLNEDEVHPAPSRRAEQHLQRCSKCRARKQDLQQQDARLRVADSNGPLPPPDAARARLQAGLTAAARRTVGSRLSLPMLLRPAVLLRGCALAALLVVAVTYRQASRPLQNLMLAYEETGPKPDHRLTPGSTSALTLAEVCRMSDNDLDPAVPVEKQLAVFRAYRMDERTARAYQVDYLINPQLGGNDSLENLWPEPYHATVWNATAKDALETRLHGMVCSGQVDLHAAQREIAADWITAYKKYFHATRPVSTMAVVEPDPLR